MRVYQIAASGFLHLLSSSSVSVPSVGLGTFYHEGNDHFLKLVTI